MEEEIYFYNQDDVMYDGRTLSKWQELLTVHMPDMPCNSHQINQTAIELNNKFQLAYNCYIEFDLICRDLERKVFVEREVKVNAKVSDFTATNRRIPGKETLNSMVTDEKLCKMEENLSNFTLMKVFFESNKDKLHKMMQLTNSLTINICASDRMYEKVQ